MPTRFSYAPIDPGYGEMGRAIAGGITGGIDRFQAGREATRLRQQEEEDRRRAEALQEMEWRTRGISERAPVPQHDFRQDPQGLQIGGELAALEGSLPGGGQVPISRPTDQAGMIGGYTEPGMGRESPASVFETGNIASGMVNTMPQRSIQTSRFERTRPEEGVFELGPNPYDPESNLYMRDREDITQLRARAEEARKQENAIKLLTREYELKSKYPSPTERRYVTEMATIDATNELTEVLNSYGKFEKGDERIRAAVIQVMANNPGADPNKVWGTVNRMAEATIPAMFDSSYTPTMAATTAATTLAADEARAPRLAEDRERERKQEIDAKFSKHLQSDDTSPMTEIWRMRLGNPTYTDAEKQQYAQNILNAAMPGIRALALEYQDLGVKEADLVARAKLLLGIR